MITKYTILPEDYEEGDTIEYTTIQDSTISNAMLFDNETEDFSFEPFTIRIYFEWYEGEDELMDDETDTAIGTGEELTFTINANISFEQVIEEEVEEIIETP